MVILTPLSGWVSSIIRVNELLASLIVVCRWILVDFNATEGYISSNTLQFLSVFRNADWATCMVRWKELYDWKRYAKVHLQIHGAVLILFSKPFPFVSTFKAFCVGSELVLRLVSHSKAAPFILQPTFERRICLRNRFSKPWKRSMVAIHDCEGVGVGPVLSEMFPLLLISL